MNWHFNFLLPAQCLHTVGEENSEVIEELSQPIIQEQLKALMSLKPVEPEHVLLKTLAAGMRTNYFISILHKSMLWLTTKISTLFLLNEKFYNWISIKRNLSKIYLIYFYLLVFLLSHQGRGSKCIFMPYAYGYTKLPNFVFKQ